MTFVINDRVKETTTSTGTGTINLAGVENGFQGFVAGIGTTNSTYYTISLPAGDYEVGIGTVTDASPDTLSRTTVISSSNSNNLVNFGAGTKDVFCTIPAKRTISPVMTATGYVVTHASTLDEDQTLDSGVLAGPVTITGTQIITGTLVVI
tara:strand:+ start:207 stop:659 length:453 start_codon:yes stop_codon:yes gene_type:complete